MTDFEGAHPRLAHIFFALAVGWISVALRWVTQASTPEGHAALAKDSPRAAAVLTTLDVFGINPVTFLRALLILVQGAGKGLAVVCLVLTVGTYACLPPPTSPLYDAGDQICVVIAKALGASNATAAEDCKVAETVVEAIIATAEYEQGSARIAKARPVSSASSVPSGGAR